MKRTYIWDKEKNELVEFERKVPEGKVWIIGDIEPYWDDDMGQEPVYVKSRQHKMALLKERRLAIK
jgi:hypothetical protein